MRGEGGEVMRYQAVMGVEGENQRAVCVFVHACVCGCVLCMCCVHVCTCSVCMCVCVCLHVCVNDVCVE